jgi:hypothetical protein
MVNITFGFYLVSRFCNLSVTLVVYIQVMGNFYFRTSQRPGIHRTLLMWSGLSPHLTKSEKPETVEKNLEDKQDRVKSTVESAEPQENNTNTTNV